MEILGIGAPELVFVIIIALIILGPKDMQKAGRTIGRWLNQLVQSDGWKAFQQTSREIRNLPTNLMRQANTELAETEKEIRKATDFRIPPASPPSRVPPQSKGTESSTQSGSPSTNPPKKQPEETTTTEDGHESNVVENSIAPPHDSPLKPQADTELTADEGHERNQAENSAPGEVSSVSAADPQSTIEPITEADDQKKPDVNTTDQNA
jgi:sec-independent protein translocase protein TatB